MEPEATKGTESNEQQSVDQRVEALLERMTLKEKVAQLGSVNAGQFLDNDNTVDRETAHELLTHGIGHLTRIGGEGGLSPTRAAKVTNELQSILVDETRLEIPAIPHEECLCGYMGPEGTTYPQMIGMASSWNPDRLQEVTEAIRTELEAIGTVQALSPVLDVARDLRWGRVEETFGEDPYLVAAMARAYVSGLEGFHDDGISATLKHFAGHGGTEGGKNRASLNIGPRELREIHLFPYEAVIQTTGAESVMNAYHDIDGIPCASSEWLLTDVLRDEWGFDGTVVSDYYSIRRLLTEHGVANTEREAAVAALEAGLDIELPYTDCYGDHLIDAVEAGELAEETLNESVRRVLRMKVRKNLFDDPYVDTAAADKPFNTADQASLTTEAARESLVLLQNEDDLLPIDNVDSVAIVGPKADSDKGLLGDYAYAAHYTGEDSSFDSTTPLDAIHQKVGSDLDVVYEQGCTTTGPSTENIEKATATAADADLTVAFVGARSAVEFSDADAEKELRPTVPTSGEGCDVTDLGLPGIQDELIRRLHETETPVVVVLVSGKPHAIPWIAENVPAVLHAWLPGEEGGKAIADVLFGDYNPSGHLPLSIAKNSGQQPVYYNRKPNTVNKTYVYTDSEPLYPFGHGIHYTDFEYSDLHLSTHSLQPMNAVTASVTITNTGNQAGDDVVQVYTSAKNPSQARPVQELVGFERLSLEPGEWKRVSFELFATQLGFYDHDMNLAVEAGPYEIRVGHSSADIGATASLELTESKDVPVTGRTYFTDTSVEPE